MSTSSVQPGQVDPYGALPTPQLTPAMLGLIHSGKVYSLSVVYTEGMPVPGPMVPYTLTPRLRHGDPLDITPATAAAEVVTMAAHTGTHIDALCHIAERQNAQGQPDDHGEPRLFAGPGQTVTAADVVNYQGQTHLSIAEMPPIVTRGLLLDVAGCKGVPVLPDAYVISAEDLRDTLTKQGSTITPGTAVLIRTGFYEHFRSGNRAYLNAVAGPGLEAAQWLVTQGMILIGADNLTVEAFPPFSHAVHRFLIVHHGITHLENLYLEELAAQQVYEFLLIAAPLRLQGATGSWVHPIAIA